MKMRFILTTLIACFGMTPVKPNQLAEEVVTGGLNGGSQVPEHFRHFFDSLTRNDKKETGAYRNLLERSAAEEKHAFHAMKEELQAERQKMAFHQGNVHSKDGGIGWNVVPLKRETSGTGNDYGQEMKKRVARSLADYVNVTVDVHERDEKNRTLLHVAAYERNMSLTDFLVNNGADVEAKDVDGRTPLHWAAHAGDVPVAVQLITAGANINTTDNRGRTALHVACIVGEPGVAHYLMHSEGFHLLKAKDNDGKTPLEVTKDKYLHRFLKDFIVQEEFAAEETRQAKEHEYLKALAEEERKKHEPRSVRSVPSTHTSLDRAEAGRVIGCRA